MPSCRNEPVMCHAELFNAHDRSALGSDIGAQNGRGAASEAEIITRPTSAMTYEKLAYGPSTLDSRQLMKAIAFVEAKHKDVIKELHKEVETMKNKNRELTYQLIMKDNPKQQQQQQPGRLKSTPETQCVIQQQQQSKEYHHQLSAERKQHKTSRQLPNFKLEQANFSLDGQKQQQREKNYQAISSVICHNKSVQASLAQPPLEGASSLGGYSKKASADSVKSDSEARSSERSLIRHMLQTELLESRQQLLVEKQKNQELQKQLRTLQQQICDDHDNHVTDTNLERQLVTAQTNVAQLKRECRKYQRRIEQLYAKTKRHPSDTINTAIETKAREKSARASDGPALPLLGGKNGALPVTITNNLVSDLVRTKRAQSTSRKSECTLPSLATTKANSTQNRVT